MRFEQILKIGSKVFSVVPEAVVDSNDYYYRKLKDNETGEEFDLVVVGNTCHYGFGYPHFRVVQREFTPELKEKFKKTNINFDLRDTEDFKENEAIEYTLIDMDGLEMPLNPNLIDSDIDHSMDDVLRFFKAFASNNYKSINIYADLNKDLAVRNKTDIILMEHSDGMYTPEISLLHFIAYTKEINVKDITNDVYNKFRNQFQKKFKESITSDEAKRIVEKANKRLDEYLEGETSKRLKEVLENKGIEGFSILGVSGLPIEQKLYYDIYSKSFTAEYGEDTYYNVNANDFRSSIKNAIRREWFDNLLKSE